MIVINIELWPLGDKSRKQTIATGTIINDGSGDLKTGNYDFSMYQLKGDNKETSVLDLTAIGKVKRFSRKLGIWALLKECLSKVDL